MPAVLSYPGVYVEERSSGARAIAGVSTSICAFVGMADRGTIDVPRRVTSFAAFARAYGETSSGEMADQVRQFFLNGGSDAYVCRIADGPVRAAVTLRNEANDANALIVRARDPGADGNLIGLEVDYDTPDPERTFNLRVFRNLTRPNGTRERVDAESFGPLSMDPDSPLFVTRQVASSLVDIEVPAPPAAVRGVSIAGLVLPSTKVGTEGTLQALMAGGRNAIGIRIGNKPPRVATLSPVVAFDDIAADWKGDINTSLAGTATVDVVLTEADLAGGGVEGGRLLVITSADGSVAITPAPGGDLSAGLMLGAAAGGIEGDTFGDLRPAPSFLVSRVGESADNFTPLRRFAERQRNAITGFVLADDSPEKQHMGPFVLGAAERMYDAGGTRSLRNVRAALDAIGEAVTNNVGRRWTVRRIGNRLTLRPTYDADRENVGASAALATNPGGNNLGTAGEIFSGAANVVAYSVGTPNAVAGTGPFQAAALAGDSGDFPKPGDYARAFRAIEQQVDLFNLMVLPRAEGQDDADRAGVWGAASAFCESERAFLLIDPPSVWQDIDAAEQGVDAVRVGVATRNAACYFSRLRITDPGGTIKVVDPGGSIAGVMAHTDARRGIWKAPAGLEANIRGVRGTERKMSDPDNGRINPKALNAIREFPAGVVVWGARTLVGFDSSGNIDDKYVPVRRTMLYIEESLYRGLKFAVFEPNDEPLWAQIRLAAGSFMNGLFRQGAFAGKKTSDAYFVVCDETTTTQADRNLGIVNVIVGFAPLKPAEFVVLTVTQMAGQDRI